MKFNNFKHMKPNSKNEEIQDSDTEKVKEKQGVVMTLLNVATVIAAIVFVISLVITFFAFKEANRSYIKENYFAYDMSDGEYNQMLSSAYQKLAEGGTLSENMLEYINAAKYFEAYSYYEAFMAVGDEERAEQSAQDMEEALNGMGELSSFAQDIRDSLDK